jgi:hypothetical protein
MTVTNRRQTNIKVKKEILKRVQNDIFVVPNLFRHPVLVFDL